MKLLKFSMLILMIASICECFIVLAYPSPSGTGYSFDLKKINHNTLIIAPK